MEVWDVDQRVLSSRFSPHRGWYWRKGFEFSADGSKLIVWSTDTTLRLWDAAKGTPSSPPLRHPGGVDTGSLSRDNRFAVGFSRGLVYLWNATSGQLFARWRNEPPGQGVATWLDLDRDRVLASSGQQTQIHPIRTYRGSRGELDFLLPLLTGRRIDHESDGIDLLPADTILRDADRYRAAFRSWLASSRPAPDPSTAQAGPASVPGPTTTGDSRTTR
jgi:WD40 repeat protein